MLEMCVLKTHLTENSAIIGAGGPDRHTHRQTDKRSAIQMR